MFHGVRRAGKEAEKRGGGGERGWKLDSYRSSILDARKRSNNKIILQSEFTSKPTAGR